MRVDGLVPVAVVPLLMAALVVAVAWASRFLAPTPRPRLHPARPPAGTVSGDHWRAGGPGLRPALMIVTGVLVIAVAAVVGPMVALAITALVGVGRLRSARARRSARQRARDAAVPDLVDLFRVAAVAGHPVGSCLRLVAPRAPEAVRPLLMSAQAQVDSGQPVAAVLNDLGPELGPLGPALTGALGGSATTGAPLGPALERVSLLARDHRRRAAEARVRRLPVTMLFPLVACVLPAFVLLAVVPLLAASLASLRI